MVRGPFLGERLGRAVSAMPIDDEDAPEPAAGQAVQDVAHDRQVGLDAQRHGAGELAEIRRHPVGEDRKDGDAERLGGICSDALGQDAVDRQAQIAVLLGAAER